MAFDHNFSRVLETADAAAALANDMALLLAQVEQFLKYNSAQEIDWSGPGAYITLDGDGNVSGRNFTPQQVSNAIGSLQEFKDLLTNGTVSQGDHIGNLSHLAKPLG